MARLFPPPRTQIKHSNTRAQIRNGGHKTLIFRVLNLKIPRSVGIQIPQCDPLAQMQSVGCHCTWERRNTFRFKRLAQFISVEARMIGTYRDRTRCMSAFANSSRRLGPNEPTIAVQAKTGWTMRWTNPLQASFQLNHRSGRLKPNGTNIHVIFGRTRTRTNQ